MAVATDGEARIEHGAAIGPQLRRILRERIIRADLLPGARLSETEMANAYGLSRQPVREAFIKLAQEGLVEVRPQRGTFVRKISIREVMDARFVREAIEADVAKLVALDPTDEIRARLRRLIGLQRAAPADQPRAFMALDEKFHRALAEAAGKSYAWRVVEDVKAQMDRVRFLSTLHFPQETLIAQHEEIADAIDARDAGAAEAATRRHLREILIHLPTIAAARADLFDPAG